MLFREFDMQKNNAFKCGFNEWGLSVSNQRQPHRMRGTQKLSAAGGTTCRHPALKKQCNCNTTEMMHLFLIFQKGQTFANSLKGKKNIDNSTSFYEMKTTFLLERNPNQQSQPSADTHIHTHTQTEKRDKIIANVKRNLHSQTFYLVHSWPHV